VFRTDTFTERGHLAKFFDELFDGVPAEFVGMMHVDSDGCLHTTGLRLEYTQTGFQLTSVPPDDFIP
jgi:hypothetical protein